MTTLAVDLALTRGAFRLEAAFEAPPGVTVLFGESGAGKTTLLHAVLGAHRPARGTVRLGGRTLFDETTDLPTRRRGVGIVFQDALLFPHLTALGNVAFAARDRDDARTWLDRAGALHLADRDPSDLSGGERQRVALARALSARPRALLLDEPFSALDAASRRALGDVVRDLASETGVPFVLVTHDLAEAVRLGDRLVAIEDGRTTPPRDPADLLAHRTAAVARALGADNLFAARIVRHRPDDGYTVADLGGVEVDVPLLSSPEGARIALALPAGDVIVCRKPPGPTSARNTLPGRIEAIDRVGATAILRVSTPVPVRASVTAESVRDLGLEPSAPVWLLIKVASFRPDP